MVINAGKTQERNTDGTFPTGVSGNPSGMKKGTKHMTTKLREAIDKISADGGTPEHVAILKKLIEKAKEGDMQAVKLIFNYLDGMPPQAFGTIDDEGVFTEQNISVVFVNAD